MHLSFPQQLEAFIEHMVETGLYNNKSDVVYDAVRRLYEKEQHMLEKLDRLRREIAIGAEQVERGELVEYDLAAIRREARANARKGKKVNPAVAPDSWTHPFAASTEGSEIDTGAHAD